MSVFSPAGVKMFNWEHPKNSIKGLKITVLRKIQQMLTMMLDLYCWSVFRILCWKEIKSYIISAVSINPPHFSPRGEGHILVIGPKILLLQWRRRVFGQGF